MDRREEMQEILDTAGNEEQQQLALSRETDAALREELSGLVNAVRLLEKSSRRQPSASFTEEVLRRLPRQRPLPGERARRFLFGSRSLRWNMATALSAGAVIIAFIVFTIMLRPAPAPVTATVRLTFYAPGARTVAVAGDFNKWTTDAGAMSRTDGVWSIELELQPGVYSYSFIVDGKTWVPDPDADLHQDDGFGFRNSVLRVTL